MSIRQIKAEIDSGSYIQPAIEYDGFAAGLLNKRQEHAKSKLDREIKGLSSEIDRLKAKKNTALDDHISNLSNKKTALQASHAAIQDVPGNAPSNIVLSAISDHPDSEAIRADIIHKHPDQVAANQAISDALNAVTEDVPIRHATWQESISAVGASVISQLTTEKARQLEAVKVGTFDPQDQSFLDAISAITGVDLRQMRTRKGSIADLNGWSPVKPGHVAMARLK